MKTREQLFGFQQKLLVLALLAAFGPAHAADDEVAKLIKPDTASISAGAAVAGAFRPNGSLFGQYNGWANNSSAVLLDFDLIQRNDETGTWVTAAGRDLGLDSRELSLGSQRQGAWKVSLDYSELVRHDPRTLNTGLQGIGSSQLTVNSLAATGTGANQNLDIKRTSYSLGLEDWITPGVSVELSVKSEDKAGARLSGVGGYCGPVVPSAFCAIASGGLLMLAEPITSNTQQLEAKLNWVGTGYSLTAGYYASLYRNDKNATQISGINGNLSNLSNLSALLSQPVSQAPDNQAYQMYLSGTYKLTPTINTTFHYAATHATQSDSFASSGTPAAAGLPSSLNGVVDSTLAQLGVTARPMPKLSLLANVRYEDIADNTPHALYGGTYSNQTNSSTKTNSKAEATYLFPENYRATFGVDYNWTKRKLPDVGSTLLLIPGDSLTSIRETTNELVYRAELRKALTDSLNATLVYSQSRRDGSHWVNLGATTSAYPNTYQPLRYVDVTAGGVFPTTMMDRNRDKVRVLLDWAASDALSLQFNGESGHDVYSAPNTAAGLKSANTFALGVDASLAVTDDWKLTGFVNYGEQLMNVSQTAGYIARLNNVTTNYGVGVLGKLSGKTEVGGDLSYLDDNNAYGLGSGNSAAPGVLPDVSYNTIALKLFAKYALDKQSDVRVDLVHQNITFHDWAWGSASTPYAYSDNSTVSMQPNQIVTYLGVKYVYRLK